MYHSDWRMAHITDNYSMPHLNEVWLFVCSKKREVVPDLAPMLWNSFGTIAALLQEIINIYPAINPPNLTVSQRMF
jgi:CCR4-NOT transcription complex subunit 9